jgi:uncharacterized membrane protein YgdD (TMEM256/DUF423 family)
VIAGLSCILAGAFAANDLLHADRPEPVLPVFAFAVLATIAAMFAARRALGHSCNGALALLLFLGLCLVCGWVYGQFHFQSEPQAPRAVRRSDPLGGLARPAWSIAGFLPGKRWES